MKEIKVGQKWKTHNDKVLEVVLFDSTDSMYPWLLDNGHWFDNQGLRVTGEFNACDLVELVFDPESTPPTDSHILSIRDAIREIDVWMNSLDALVDEKRQERERLLSELNSLGLDFVVEKEVNEVVKEQDMSDPKNWKVGDIVVALKTTGDQFTKGNTYEIRSIDSLSIGTMCDDIGSETNGWHVQNFKFHSRPSKEKE